MSIVLSILLTIKCTRESSNGGIAFPSPIDPCLLTLSRSRNSTAAEAPSSSPSCQADRQRNNADPVTPYKAFCRPELILIGGEELHDDPLAPRDSGHNRQDLRIGTIRIHLHDENSRRHMVHIQLVEREVVEMTLQLVELPPVPTRPRLPYSGNFFFSLAMEPSSALWR